MAKTRIAEMEKEKEEMANKLKKAERELGQVLRREKRKMKEVDEKACQAGYDRAGAEYLREARSMVNDEIKVKVPIVYRTGYKAGVKAGGEAMQLEPDLSLILAPVVPELELPYTAEECEPLPAKEFLESDDDIEDITEANAEGGDGSGGGNGGDGENVSDSGKVAKDTQQQPMDVEKTAVDVAKNSEAEANVVAPENAS